MRSAANRKWSVVNTAPGPNSWEARALTEMCSSKVEERNGNKDTIPTARLW